MFKQKEIIKVKDGEFDHIFVNEKDQSMHVIYQQQTLFYELSDKLGWNIFQTDIGGIKILKINLISSQLDIQLENENRLIIENIFWDKIDVDKDTMAILILHKIQFLFSGLTVKLIKLKSLSFLQLSTDTKYPNLHLIFRRNFAGLEEKHFFFVFPMDIILDEFLFCFSNCYNISENITLNIMRHPKTGNKNGFYRLNNQNIQGRTDTICYIKEIISFYEKLPLQDIKMYKFAPYIDRKSNILFLDLFLIKNKVEIHFPILQPKQKEIRVLQLNQEEIRDILKKVVFLFEMLFSDLYNVIITINIKQEIKGDLHFNNIFYSINNLSRELVFTDFTFNSIQLTVDEKKMFTHDNVTKIFISDYKYSKVCVNVKNNENGDWFNVKQPELYDTQEYRVLPSKRHSKKIKNPKKLNKVSSNINLNVSENQRKSENESSSVSIKKEDRQQQQLSLPTPPKNVGEQSKRGHADINELENLFKQTLNVSKEKEKEMKWNIMKPKKVFKPKKNGKKEQAMQTKKVFKPKTIGNEFSSADNVKNVKEEQVMQTKKVFQPKKIGNEFSSADNVKNVEEEQAMKPKKVFLTSKGTENTNKNTYTFVDHYTQLPIDVTEEVYCRLCILIMHLTQAHTKLENPQDEMVFQSGGNYSITRYKQCPLGNVHTIQEKVLYNTPYMHFANYTAPDNNGVFLSLADGHTFLTTNKREMKIQLSNVITHWDPSYFFADRVVTVFWNNHFLITIYPGTIYNL